MNRTPSVILLNEKYHSTWNDYVTSHPRSAFSHRLGWKNIIEKTYGHKTYYIVAVRVEEGERSVAGVLPLVHLKHPLFGNSLVSMPFLDHGGILADNPETERSLLEEAVRLGKSLGTRTIELRHLEPIVLSRLNRSDDLGPSSETKVAGWTMQVRSHKVRMLLPLPTSSEILMRSFKSKLRSQVQKPKKEGLVSRVGGEDLVDDFYKVFSTHMRDLGSPVHSKKFIANILLHFRHEARITLVYHNDDPVACGLMIGFKGTMSNPWASSLLEHRELSPNMLLYWTMLEYASNHGFKVFDLGRSSVGEGTYHFKEQWGAKPVPLYWHYASNGYPLDVNGTDKTKFSKAISLWQKLPVPVTKILGPRIRKYIPL